MREPKTSWIQALRSLTGNETDTVRFNDEVGRWEFVMVGADGISRSQFWGVFYNPFNGQPIEPDGFTGMHPYRDLDDDGMREALANLEKTFVGNAHDGHTSTARTSATQKEVLKRMRWNKAEGQRRWKQGGVDFADMTTDVAGRGARLRGALSVGYNGTPGQRSRRIEIPTVIGGSK